MSLIQNFIRNNLHKKSLLSFLLLPISLVFSFISVLRRRFYLFFFPVYKSKIKIISVGNIVAGGVGKTPFVIFLAKYLRNKGYKVAVSHRGYKGDFENKVTLISDFNTIFPKAEKSGDESYLIAKKLEDIPVICGKNRRLAVKILEKKFPELDYIILDDSFQHLKLNHNLDFLIFSEESFIGNGFVLPAGILREPFFMANKADIIVWNGNRNPPQKLVDLNKPTLQFKYVIKKIYDKNGRILTEKEIINSTSILVSGIGNPASFEKFIKQNFKDITILHHFAFPDHFKYDENSVKKIKNYIKKNKISNAITTEKDFDKLKSFNLPLVIISIKGTVANKEILDKFI